MVIKLEPIGLKDQLMDILKLIIWMEENSEVFFNKVKWFLDNLLFLMVFFILDNFPCLLFMDLES